MEPGRIFLSYAHEDIAIAQRIYRDLTEAGLRVWFDKVDLLPGQRWKNTVIKAIRESRYFLALLSSKSILKKGYVQKEITEALEVLDEFPESDVFVIPARIEECTPSHRKLHEIHWVDLFPYEEGLGQLLRLFNPKPLTSSIIRPALVETKFENVPIIDIDISTDIQKVRGKSITSEKSRITRIKAVIDTGADISMIPKSVVTRLIQQLDMALPYELVTVEDFNGVRSSQPVYSLNLHIADMAFPEMQLMAGNDERAIIGRDVLQELLVLFDFKKRMVRIWRSGD